MIRSARLLTLALAVAATVGFTMVRNHYDLEDSAFFLALAASCASAAIGATTVSLALRNALRRALVHGSTAGLLVPVLYGVWLFPVHIGACLVGGGVCDSS
jgi:heme A synthase